jgi:hypothetical protein
VFSSSGIQWLLFSKSPLEIVELRVVSSCSNWGHRRFHTFSSQKLCNSVSIHMRVVPSCSSWGHPFGDSVLFEVRNYATLCLYICIKWGTSAFWRTVQFPRCHSSVILGKTPECSSRFCSDPKYFRGCAAFLQVKTELIPRQILSNVSCLFIIQFGPPKM